MEILTTLNLILGTPANLCRGDVRIHPDLIRKTEHAAEISNRGLPPTALVFKGIRNAS